MTRHLQRLHQRHHQRLHQHHELRSSMMSRWRASSPRHHKRHHKRQHKRQHKRHQRHLPSDPSDRGSRTPTATPDCRPPSQSHTLRGCQPAGSSGPHNESLGVRDIRSTAKKPPANWCDEAGSVLCWGRYDWKKLPKPVNKAEWCNMAPKRACARARMRRIRAAVNHSREHACF